LFTLFTETENTIAELVATGFNNTDIATVLGVSIHTVENHLTVIYQKTGVRSRHELKIFIDKNR